MIAEEQPILRAGLRAFLTATPDLLVVGETGDGCEVPRVVHETQPDVLVMDLMLPGDNGLALVEQLASRQPLCRILILTLQDDDATVRRALRVGAAGYLLKADAAEELPAGVRAVAAGHLFLSTPLCDRAIVLYAQNTDEPTSTSVEPDPLSALTLREKQVLRLMAEGFGNGQIGQQLGISPRTAEVHRAHVMRKLRLGSQTELVHFAIRHGLSVVDKT